MFASLIILGLGLAAPARAWMVKSDSAATARGLRAESDRLPACVRETVARRLRVVLAVPRALTFPIDAHSWPTNGVMLLTTDRAPELRKTAYLHELGHFYDWETGTSKGAAFRAALAADFASMDSTGRAEEKPLSDPQEAFAELFAARFRGPDYFRADHYEVWRFPATRTLVDRAICADAVTR